MAIGRTPIAASLLPRATVVVSRCLTDVIGVRVRLVLLGAALALGCAPANPAVSPPDPPDGPTVWTVTVVENLGRSIIAYDVASALTAKHLPGCEPLEPNSWKRAADDLEGWYAKRGVPVHVDVYKREEDEHLSVQFEVNPEGTPRCSTDGSMCERADEYVLDVLPLPSCAVDHGSAGE